MTKMPITENVLAPHSNRISLTGISKGVHFDAETDNSTLQTFIAVNVFKSWSPSTFKWNSFYDSQDKQTSAATLMPDMLPKVKSKTKGLTCIPLIWLWILSCLHPLIPSFSRQSTYPAQSPRTFTVMLRLLVNVWSLFFTVSVRGWSVLSTPAGRIQSIVGAGFPVAEQLNTTVPPAPPSESLLWTDVFTMDIPLRGIESGYSENMTSSTQVMQLDDKINVKPLMGILKFQAVIYSLYHIIRGFLLFPISFLAYSYIHIKYIYLALSDTSSSIGNRQDTH